MRKLSLFSIVLLLVLPATILSAQEDGKRQRGNRDRAMGQKTDRPANGDRANRGNRGERPQMDPARIVARMMQEFDQDGDKKLDEKELTKLLVAMRERGGMMRGGAQRGQGRPDGDQMKNRRRGGADTGEKSGGDKPKRPSSDG